MTAELVPPKPAGAACAQCPARDTKCVWPEAASNANGRARLAIVGEGPGRNELEQGRPFIGASGRMLMRGMKTLGLQRSDIHWTNAVLCECPAELLPKAAKQCAARLRAELAAVQAPVVMPVGAFGLQSSLQLPRRPQILKWRGSVSEISYGKATGTGDPAPIVGSGTLVAPTIHPAFIMRAPKWAPVLEIDVARVGRLLALVSEGKRWLPPEAQQGRRVVIARDEGTLLAGLESLGAAVGNDVETVGLGPITTRLVCLALSDGPTTLVIPWSRGRDGRDPWWPFPDRIAAAITRALASRVSVTHNGAAFDFIVEDRYGIHVAKWEDTLLAAHATEAHMPKNLAHVVTQGLDVPPWKQLEDRTADLERLWFYNARDTLYTILRWHQLKGLVT
jgi:uracil-DNA glycosylase family 4